MSLTDWTLLLVALLALVCVAVIVFCLIRLHAVTAPRHRASRQVAAK